MKPTDLIRLPKAVVEAGDWKVVTGKAKMPKSAFPLSRSYGVVLGRNWHWRVDVLEAGGASFRLLTAYHADTLEYRAWLSMPAGPDHVIVGQLEFHGSHPGWHCHVACCDLREIEAGQAHPRIAARLPGGNRPHRRLEFDVTDSTALSTAFNFFRVTGTPKDALL